MYCKLDKENNRIIPAPVNDLERGIMNYNQNVEMMVADGYKLFVEAEPYNHKRYHLLTYEETDTEIHETIQWQETEEEYAIRSLEEAKKAKHKENNEKAEIDRENKFFTLTIQDKVCSFQTTRKTQQDLETAKSFIQMTEKPYQWFSDNNEEVYLTLEDVVSISTTFMGLANVYPTWSSYETQIDSATTVEEVEAIVIDYTINEAIEP